jgi:hypothetical protein
VASWHCTVSYPSRSSSHGTLEKLVSYTDHSVLMVTDGVDVKYLLWCSVSFLDPYQPSFLIVRDGVPQNLVRLRTSLW